MNDLCRVLEWDSEFFGRKIARVCPTRLSPAEADAVLDWCQQNQVECLYFLSEDEPTSISQAERLGCHLTDVRVELQWTASRSVANNEWPADLTIRAFQPADLLELEKIAAQAFTRTRFYADEHFGREYADRLYVLWVRRSCGDAETVLVAESSGQTAGFITFHVDSQGGQIGLLGVADRFRGRRIGAALLHAVQRPLLHRGVARLTVVTQGRNIAAQRLYQAGGFRSHRQQLWYHRWFS